MSKKVKDRFARVKSVLVSQPKPTNPNSPYFTLARKYNIKIDFAPFIQVEPISVKEFRQQKINILSHTAIIFTSRNAVDHFFDLCKQIKIDIPADMKYFCISEQTANYLQKYIVIRKRKIFTGARTPSDLIEVLKKHKNAFNNPFYTAYFFNVPLDCRVYSVACELSSKVAESEKIVFNRHVQRFLCRDGFFLCIGMEADCFSIFLQRG